MCVFVCACAGFAMLMTAFGMFATPFCKKALILAALVSSVGVSMGILDTGENKLVHFPVHSFLHVYAERVFSGMSRRFHLISSSC